MHLFIDCSVVKHMWFGLSLQHMIDLDLEWIDDYFLHWHDSTLGLSPYNVSWPSIGAIVLVPLYYGVCGNSDVM